MEKPESIFICQVDERAAFRRDEHYPQLIFLGTALRWAVAGNILSEEADRKDDIVQGNNFALDSIAAFLADYIESGDVSVFGTHSRLPLGSAEKETILGKLRGLDGGIVGGLVDEAGFRYYVNGQQLFRAVMTSSLPINDDFEKGGVWLRLALDAPSAWRDEFNPGTTQLSAKAELQTTENRKSLDSVPAIVRRKRAALIKELQPVMPSIERDLKDAPRQSSGLSRRARLEHSYWNMAEVVAWGVENGKITRDNATRRITTEPTSELSILLNQLMK